MTCAGSSVVDTDSELYSTYIDGIKWLRTPTSGNQEPGIHNFTYYLYSSANQIVNAKMELVNLTGDILSSATNTSCNDDSCYIVLSYNASEGDNIK